VGAARRKRTRLEWLADQPGLLAQWHPTRNGDLDPVTVRAAASRLVWWRCGQGHEWQARVFTRAWKGTGCPTCAGQRATAERNLAVLHPAVAATWHPSKNAQLMPTDVLPASMKRVWWQCAEGHEWEITVDKRVGRDCPFCSGRRVTPENNLAAMHPERARQWHPTRNGDLTPQEVLPGYSRLVWWLCGTCGHEWQAKPSSRMRGSGCRECSRSFPRRATEPLSVTHPEVAAQWHPTANGGATPDQVTYGSGRRVWWQCAAGHEWEATVASRASSGNRCPYCAGKRASAERNLAVTAPALAAQWHPTRNGNLVPKELLPGTARRVWWQCETGHAWKSSPNARQYGDKGGCPYCAGLRVTAETNLAAVFPLVATEWHPTHNGDLRPDEVRPHTSRKVWWRCGVCGHDWAAAVKNRTSGRGRCPMCARVARTAPRPRR